MRARNVKPSLFKNELLATSDPLNTWIFEGLWCMADREGRLEDRPRRIHLEINPGRAYEGTELALVWLAEHGFILRYTNGANQYIQVINFDKHQNPHPREIPSVIPAPGIDVNHGLGGASENTHINESSSLGNTQAQPRTDPSTTKAQAGRALSPSPLPLPPSLNPLPPEEKDTSHAPRARVPSRHIEGVFSHWQKIHEHPQAKLDTKRRSLITRRLHEFTYEQLCESISGYKLSPFHNGENENGTAYDSIELMLRDVAHVERGLTWLRAPPTPKAKGGYSEPKITWTPPPDDEEQSGAH
jgi:hypothetical protein